MKFSVQSLRASGLLACTFVSLSAASGQGRFVDDGPDLSVPAASAEFTFSEVEASQGASGDFAPLPPGPDPVEPLDLAPVIPGSGGLKPTPGKLPELPGFNEPTMVPVPFDINKKDSGVSVTWNGIGILQRSKDLQQWFPDYESSTPLDIPNVLGERYFRVVTPNPPCPGSLADLTKVDWASIRLPQASFGAHFDTMVGKGMRIIDIEVYTVGDNNYVGAVWQKNVDHRKWASLRNMTGAQYVEKWELYKNAGYRLIDQETYYLNGKLRFAGVWEENKENLSWASFRNITSQHFTEVFNAYRSQYTPIDIDGISHGNGGLRYNVAWVKGCAIDWKLLRNMNSDQLSAAFDTYAEQGFRVSKITSYRHNGTQYYAAIWLKNTSKRSWRMWRRMTGQQYSEKWTELRDKGYRLVDFAGYETANGTRYAGVWREND